MLWLYKVQCIVFTLNVMLLIHYVCNFADVCHAKTHNELTIEDSCWLYIFVITKNWIRLLENLKCALLVYTSMGVEKNGRYLKNGIYEHFSVNNRCNSKGFCFVFIFLNPRQTGVVAYRCAIYIYTKIYRIYVQTRYDNT